MTTQRDRLATVLHETWRETHDNNWTFDEWADALLALGVRVVDRLEERLLAAQTLDGQINVKTVLAIVREEIG